MKLRAKTDIRATLQELWQHTQDPAIHARWDLRFTTIDPLPREEPEAPQRFRYRTRIGFGIFVDGWGESLGTLHERRSILRFGSDQALSLIREGGGYWEYQEDPGSVSLETVYDYRVRGGIFGRSLDSACFRPLMIWATRWSFDRLRLWLESGLPPETSFRIWMAKTACRVSLGLIWCLEGLIPKILVVAPAEIDLVHHSGLYIGSPAGTLFALGIAEFVFGLWLLWGKAERLTAVLAVIGTTMLGGLVAFLDPSSLVHPFGGLVKNLALVAGGIAIYALEPISPKAARARP